jgi:hypothetical protein
MSTTSNGGCDERLRAKRQARSARDVSVTRRAEIARLVIRLRRQFQIAAGWELSDSRLQSALERRLRSDSCVSGKAFGGAEGGEEVRRHEAGHVRHGD